MEKYKDESGNSGISAYRIGPDWIMIKFMSGKVYKYSYRSAGKDNVEQMKDLAQRGTGLTTYINKYVKDLFE